MHGVKRTEANDTIIDLWFPARTDNKLRKHFRRQPKANNKHTNF